MEPTEGISRLRRPNMGGLRGEPHSTERAGGGARERDIRSEDVRSGDNGTARGAGGRLGRERACAKACRTRSARRARRRGGRGGEGGDRGGRGGRGGCGGGVEAGGAGWCVLGGFAEGWR